MQTGWLKKTWFSCWKHSSNTVNTCLLIFLLWTTFYRSVLRRDILRLNADFGREGLLCFGQSRVSPRSTLLSFFSPVKLSMLTGWRPRRLCLGVVEGHVVTERMKRHQLTFNLSLYIHFPLEWLCGKSTLLIMSGYFEFLIILKMWVKLPAGLIQHFKKYIFRVIYRLLLSITFSLLKRKLLGQWIHVRQCNWRFCLELLPSDLIFISFSIEQLLLS